MDVLKVIGWNVKRLRLELKLSQEELALRIEVVNQGYVSELEHGKRNPTAVLIALIARALGTSVGSLFETDSITENWASGSIKLHSRKTGKASVGD